MDMKTDAQLLVMSEGKSNILPADVIVPFQPSTLSYSEAVTPEVLEAWRWYLATVRQLTHSIEPEMQKVFVTLAPLFTIKCFSGSNYLNNLFNCYPIRSILSS